MANDTVKRLLARVRQLRVALGLSQEAFAEKAGLKYKHYQAIEAGRKSDIRFSTLEKISTACGLELAELLDFKTDPVVLTEASGNEFKTATGKTSRKPGPRRSTDKNA